MRAPVFDFAMLIDSQIEALSRQEYFLRTGRAKHLLEELYPLSRFALALKFLGSRVEVEAFEHNEPVDGVIRFLDKYSSELHVEVTYVHSYEDALRRELMWRTGSTPGTGRIYRDKTSGEIVAFSELEPYQVGIDKLASSIANLHQKKAHKQYPRGTNLLVAFEDPTFFGQDQWRALFTALREKTDLSGGNFSDTHIINCGTNELMSNANF
jgi:hypothetical protein